VGNTVAEAAASVRHAQQQLVLLLTAGLICYPGQYIGDGDDVRPYNRTMTLQEAVVHAKRDPRIKGFTFKGKVDDLSADKSIVVWFKSKGTRPEGRSANPDWCSYVVGPDDPAAVAAADEPALAATYIVLQQATVREGKDASSKNVGRLKKGTVIEVVEHSRNSDGLEVLRTTTPLVGWLKIFTSKNVRLVEQEPVLAAVCDMGFSEPDATEALAACGNDRVQAIRWLQLREERRREIEHYDDTLRRFMDGELGFRRRAQR
jgi:hypothetical protein